MCTHSGLPHPATGPGHHSSGHPRLPGVLRYAAPVTLKPHFYNVPSISAVCRAYSSGLRLLSACHNCLAVPAGVQRRRVSRSQALWSKNRRHSSCSVAALCIPKRSHCILRRHHQLDTVALHREAGQPHQGVGLLADGHPRLESGSSPPTRQCNMGHPRSSGPQHPPGHPHLW